MNLLSHSRIIKGGIQPTIFAFNQLIHWYAKQGLFRDAQKVFDEMPDRNVFTWNTIIAAHIKSHDLAGAESLFGSTPYKDVVTYNSMLSGFVLRDGCEANAMKLFAQMHSAGIGIDEFTVTSMLNLLARLSLPSLGMQLHSYMVKSGNGLSKFSVSSLIDMYSKCGCFEEAYLVFAGCGLEMDLVSKNSMVAACCREGELQMALDIFWDMPELNDTVSWNTVIAGLEQNGLYLESVELFTSMVKNGVRLNEHTFASVLGACSGLRSVRLGKEVHARVLKYGLYENPYISSGIVDVYSKCGRMRYAELTNAMFGIENTFSITSLIVGYSSLGDMEKARSLFDLLEEKNFVVWTALFSGYVKCQKCEPIFPLLKTIIEKESIFLDPAMLVSVLGACSLQASLDPGKQIHCYILRKGIHVDKKLVSAIIDMYCKCGCIGYAKSLFHGAASNRDSVLYNVMIAGYAHHGLEDKAIELFDEMIGEAIRPEAATFIALLSACRHAGFVELGEEYFHSMEKDYGISPEIDHYACMVDLYGRANKLEKALSFIREIPIQPDAVIWGAFLNACKINGNVELAREAKEEMLRIEGNVASRYVQIANLYAAEGNWSEMQRVRKRMKGLEVKKSAGCSWVFLDSEVCIFTSGDTTHPKSDSIHSVLDFLTMEINHVIMVEKSKACSSYEVS